MWTSRTAELNIMAAALSVLLLLLHTCSASPLKSEPPEPEQVPPHLTNCVSSDMETFHCRWTVGTFQNLSEPGDLRLFYFNRLRPLTPSQKNWSECPHYSTERPNECFFNKNHTTIWTSYTVQLQSKDQTVLYDEITFDVSVIVQPDPPVGLNWMMLNSSLTGAHFDIMVKWKPPRSADVETGWIALQYEVQYRSVDSDKWETTDLVKSTQRSLYGLQTNVNHEVRVRCKMLGGKFFGGFSHSVFVHIPSKEKDSLHITVQQLQQTLQEQCDLKVENEKLKSDILKLKEQNERAAEVREAEVQQLVGEMRAAAAEGHKRELEDVQQEALQQLAAKDAEVKKLLEDKRVAVEEMKRLKEQDRERKSELLKLQMEFGAKLARVQSSAERSQQQRHGSSLLPQSVLKQKLHFFQEEKNKEIAALRQRIKELEERARPSSLTDNRLKKRKF
ncbi:growth hormone receptor b isoform X2 [Nematolebias whitei]|uniref:growth hormone receptor b isoform X2 n=1 Tax=Nematolebias whitei TaxID=451745 RepID=UPI001899EA9D|nr:growth hormone receptor b isoform X2 [Nematolebias whitei]